MPSTRLLRLVVIALTTLVTGAFALSAWRDHALTREENEGDLAEVARLMQEHTRAALQVGELQLARMQDVLGRRLPAQFSGPVEASALRHLIADLPFMDSLWVFGADGTMRASTYALPPGGMSITDRAYYTALRDGARDFASPLIWGRLRHEPFVVLSRRIDDAGGRFAGGIAATIKIAYFTDFYRNLSPQPGAEFVVFKDDGSLMLRSHLPEGQEVFPPPTILLDHARAARTGTYVARSRMDGIERLYAYSHMNDYPAIVVAGLPLDQVFAGWRERTLRNAVIALVILAAFLAIAARLAATLRREAALRARAETSLADKEMLFQEIHHRVKNNLQIIASFLTMQAVHARDSATADAFEEALSRLQSMGLVHQILYEQNEASEVAMATYLQALAASIDQTFGAGRRGIAIAVEPSDVKLPMDQAVPLALLANEALTNALKHAFPDGRSGRVTMEVRRDDGALTFVLADDGVGMNTSARSGLGTVILNALARQLNGELAWSTGPGTRLAVSFPG